MGQDRSSVLPSSFLSKGEIPIITVSTVITVITTAAERSSLAAEGAHRLQDRSAPARWDDGIPGDNDAERPYSPVSLSPATHSISESRRFRQSGHTSSATGFPAWIPYL